MKKILGIALTLLFSATLQANAAVVLLNGSFEAPQLPGQIGVSPPTVINNWTVTGNSVDLLRNYQGYAASEGQQYIDLAGSPGPGGVYQGISLVANQEYTVTFDYSRNPDLFKNTVVTGLVKILDSVGGALGIQATVTSNPATQPIIGPAPPGLNWLEYVFKFVAPTTGNFRIQFESGTPTNENRGSLFIDNVAIAETPEPTTIVVWGGLAAIGGIVAYRRRIAA